MAALASYRAFLRVAAGMDTAARSAAIAQARSELSFFRDVVDQGEIARLVDAFDGKIAFLRMSTPKRRSTQRQRGATRTVYKSDGTTAHVATSRDKAAYQNWDGANMDPDSVARHNHSLRRMGFRDNAHAKGYF
mmetsp:Transcript_2673/g.8025  ORF Transcript_2673/g.8025 Transcript_2673/m.8025 type:complete len:134 (+) Transcript_2673:146-547(+)